MKNYFSLLCLFTRHGKRDAKKLKKKASTKAEEPETQKPNPNANLGIYDEIGDYVPDISKKDQVKDVKKTSFKDEENNKKGRDYFGMESSSSSKKEFSDSGAISKEAATAFIKSVSEKYAAKELVAKKEEKKSGMSVKFDPDSYAECYPGYFHSLGFVLKI